MNSSSATLRIWCSRSDGGSLIFVAFFSGILRPDTGESLWLNWGRRHASEKEGRDRVKATLPRHFRHAV